MLVKAAAIEPVTVVPYRTRKEIDTWRPVEIHVDIRDETNSYAPVVMRIGKDDSDVCIRLGPRGYLAPIDTPGSHCGPTSGMFASWRKTELHAAAPDLWRLKGSPNFDIMVGEARRYVLRNEKDRVLSHDNRAPEQYRSWLERNLVSIEGILHAPRIPPMTVSGGASRRYLVSDHDFRTRGMSGHDLFFDDTAHADAWDRLEEAMPPYEIVDADAVHDFDFTGWKLKQGCIALVNRLSEVHVRGRSRLSMCKSDAMTAFAALRDALVADATSEEIREAALRLASVEGSYPPILSSKSVAFLEAGEADSARRATF